MTPCSVRHRSCGTYHLNLVTGYRLWRISWEQMKEAQAGDYPEEGRLFVAANPPPTFKSWLLLHARQNRE